MTKTKNTLSRAFKLEELIAIYPSNNSTLGLL